MASNLMMVGMRAVAANYTALQVTGNNIANANVQGYSRQRAEIEPSAAHSTSGGFFGMGAEVKTVTRQYDALRTREAMHAQSMASMDAARLQGLTQLEAVFPVGEQGIGYAASQFLNAMADVATRPTEIASRQVVLARAADVAQRFSEAASRIEQIQSTVAEEVSAGVARVNQIAIGLAEINGQLSRTVTLGHTPNDLLDQRDRLLAQLNGYIQTTQFEADDGSVTVLIPGGHTLVDGVRSNALSRVADTQDPTRVGLASTQQGVSRPIASQSLAGGSIAGWMRLQNEDLAAARSEVGRMASALAGTVNQQQMLGLDLRGQAGTDLFRVGAPQVVSATTNARAASGGYASQVRLEITDPSALAASEYDLRKAPGAAAGEWQLVRLSDGLARSVSDGQEIDGFRLRMPAPEPAASDAFRLKPVSGAAQGMRSVLSDPRWLAAASPVTAQVPVTNTGTASVDVLRATTPSNDPNLALRVVFTSDAGAYRIVDSAGAVVGSPARQWTPGQPIAFEGFTSTVGGETVIHDAFELSLAGAPRLGDAFDVVRTPFAMSNNGNAQAMLALRDTAFVGRTVDAQGILDTGKTFNDTYASAVGSVGVTVQRARTAADISEGMAKSSEASRASNAGVNLDEEAARLLQFQQSYQAGAKVLQAAQTVFDSLLQVIG